MALAPPRSRSQSSGLLRELAKGRLAELETASAEDWATAVEEAREQGFQPLRFPGLIVKIRDYSLRPCDSGDPTVQLGGCP
jgi:hypothetical protein